MSLEEFELLAILKANDVVVFHRPANGNSRNWLRLTDAARVTKLREGAMNTRNHVWQTHSLNGMIGQIRRHYFCAQREQISFIKCHRPPLLQLPDRLV